jgi:hypothetical protein
LAIQDRYADVGQYDDYIKLLREFTALPLDRVPVFDRKDLSQLEEWRRRGFASDPRDQVDLIHVTPTYLGKFGAVAALEFSSRSIEKISALSEAELWAGFATAYAAILKLGSTPVWPLQGGWDRFLLASKSLVFWPMRLFNFRKFEAEAYNEAERSIGVLRGLGHASRPSDKLSEFFRLFESSYPSFLANLNEIPREVSFAAQSKGRMPPKMSALYNKLNNSRVHAGPVFPVPSRYSKARAKLSQFYLDQPHEAAKRPRIQRIQVTTREVPAALRSFADDTSADIIESPASRSSQQAFMVFSAKQIDQARPIKVYVRVQQAGRVKLGKLELVAKVFDLEARDVPSLSAEQSYEFYVTGPLSPLSTFLLDRATADGDDLQFTMAISQDGVVWSDERDLQFRFENGKLFPVTDVL